MIETSDVQTRRGKEVFKHLRAISVEMGLPIHTVVIRYALERFLYRLFKAGDGGLDVALAEDKSFLFDKEKIVLKGGMTLTFADGRPPLAGRATGDVDLHLTGFPGKMEDYKLAIETIMWTVTCDDGIDFDIAKFKISHERDESTGGALLLFGEIGGYKFQFKTDVTFDHRPMQNHARIAEYPCIITDLGLEPPLVRLVPWEFLIADKFSASLQYGMANKRMRDYPDMALILMKGLHDEEALAEIIAATLKFRKFELPSSVDAMPAFSDEFGTEKQARWAVEKDSKNYDPTLKGMTFLEVVRIIRHELGPVIERCHSLENIPSWHL